MYRIVTKTEYKKLLKDPEFVVYAPLKGGGKKNPPVKNVAFKGVHKEVEIWQK